MISQQKNYNTRAGDVIIIYDTHAPETNDIIPQNIPLDIVYEDEDLMVINKPVGMVVHHGCGNPDNTLLNAVAWHMQENCPNVDEKELTRYGLVHRIDKKHYFYFIVVAKSKIF